MRVALALALSVSALAASPLAGQNEVVKGTVVDSTGAPVGRAYLGLPELGRRALSDPDGQFTLGPVPPGQYTLVANSPGFRPFAQRIRVPLSEPVVLRLLPQTATFLAPVTVTATRDTIDPRDSPLPASELSGDALRRSISVSLARAVEELPGLRTLSTGEQIGKPVIRGLAGSRVLVLENGLRLEDYSWSDEDGPSVDARLAERVEVIRGPASVLYGSDAVGGVINVLPADLPRADPGR